MRFFTKRKDGGPDSNATGYWLIEIKSLFSIVLLKFEGDSRTNFHNHAFNALTWLIGGQAYEHTANGETHRYERSVVPKYTPRSRMHKVTTHGVAWMLSVRGPWSNKWKEYNPVSDETITLTHGRQLIK
jgi:hypothetical protein